MFQSAEEIRAEIEKVRVPTCTAESGKWKLEVKE